jgi:hypothetical protein
MATYTDLFDRLDQIPIQAPWVKLFGGLDISIVSEKVVGQAGSGDSVITLPSLTFDNDQSAEVTITFLTTDGDVGVVVRASDPNNYYSAVYDPTGDDLYIRKNVAGVNTSVFTASNIGAVSGDSIKLEAIGTTVSVYLNGVFLDSRVDTDLTSGSVGIVFQRRLGEAVETFTAEGYVPAITASITDVDGDNILTGGQQDVSMTVSGFSGDLTSVSLRVGEDTIELTDLVKIS